MNYREPSPSAPLLLFSSCVTALDRQTGQPLWIYNPEQNIRRFALDSERLFVFDAESVLHCIQLANGQLLGRVNLGM